MNSPVRNSFSVPEGEGSSVQPAPHTFLPANTHTLPPLDTSKPTLQEYAAAAESAYQLTTDHGKYNKNYTPPEGFTIIRRSDEEQLKNGFSAVALKDLNGNVIVAYEGTIIGGRGYNRDSLISDAGIAANETTKALENAREFAKQVQEETGQKVFLAGHSLGGIEAESAAQSFMTDKKLEAKFGGGTTFGATGLPGNDQAGPVSMHNYVKYGDTVGNDSSDFRQDALSQPSNNLSARQDHFGKVEMIGSPSDAAVLTQANESQDKMLGALLIPSLGSAFEASFYGAKAATKFLSGIEQFHGIAEYEKSLKITPGASPLYPFVSDGIHTHVTQLGSSLKDTGLQITAQVHAPQGSLVSPDPVRDASAGPDPVRGQG